MNENFCRWGLGICILICFFCDSDVVGLVLGCGLVFEDYCRIRIGGKIILFIELVVVVEN